MAWVRSRVALFFARMTTLLIGDRETHCATGLSCFLSSHLRLVRPVRGGMLPARVYFGQIIAVATIMLAAIWDASHWAPASLGHWTALGSAWFTDFFCCLSAMVPVRVVVRLRGLCSACLRACRRNCRGLRLCGRAVGQALHDLWLSALGARARKSQPQVCSSQSACLRQNRQPSGSNSLAPPPPARSERC